MSFPLFLFQCVSDLVSTLSGINLNSVENKLEAFQDHAENLVNALEELNKALESQKWKNVEKFLFDVSGFLTKVGKFFGPFEPIADIVNYKVSIPWVELPYLKKKMG